MWRLRFHSADITVLSNSHFLLLQQALRVDSHSSVLEQQHLGPLVDSQNCLLSHSPGSKKIRYKVANLTQMSCEIIQSIYNQKCKKGKLVFSINKQLYGIEGGGRELWVI